MLEFFELEYLWGDPGSLSQQSTSSKPKTIGHVDIINEVIRVFPWFGINPLIRAKSSQCKKREGSHEKCSTNEYPNVKT